MREFRVFGTMFTFFVLITLTDVLVVPTYADTGRSGYAKQIVKDAIEKDWDFETTYIQKLCPRHKKSLSAPAFASTREKMKEQWVSGREYGKALAIDSVIESDENQSIGYQVDVKAKDEKTGKGVTFRFWIDGSGSTTCMSGFNFF